MACLGTNRDHSIVFEIASKHCRSIWSRLWFFQWSCMDVSVGLWRKLSMEKWMLLNCGVGEDSWESLNCKEIQPVHPKGDQSWVFIGQTDAKTETPILWPPHAKWKSPWCWDGLAAGGEGDDWGWNGWMASLTQWIWVWVNSRSLWWTGRPGVLRFMESQKVGHDWETELNCILDSFVDHDGYSISSKGFLSTVVCIMIISLKFTHSSPF